MSRKSRIVAAALVLLPLIFAALAPALAGSTQTGTIRGRVVDSKGQPMPGATVVLRSEAMVRERATVTDADGNYFAPGLLPGQFQVIASLSGYQTVAAKTEVIIDKTTTVNLTMTEGGIVETVTVTAEKPVVSKTQTETTTVVDQRYIDTMPVGRTYQGLIQLAPGVTGAANPNMLGGTSNSNVYLTDGVSIRDPVTGTFGANLNFDAIEAVDVKLTGVSAEYGQFQGGLTNVITKSGGNEFTGSVKDLITEPDWTRLYSSKSQDQFAAPNPALGYSRPTIPGRPPGGTAQKRDNRFQITAGGPIVTDRAWFFGSYDKNASTGSATTQDGNAYRTFFDGDFSQIKGTWAITGNQRVQYFYSRDPADLTRDYGALFFGGSYSINSIDVQSQGGNVWIANWNAVWGPRLVTDAKYSEFKNAFFIQDLAPPVEFAGQPRSDTGNLVAPAVLGFTFDPNPQGLYDTHVFASNPEERLRKQTEASATYFFDAKGLGTHTIKVGGDYYKQDHVGSSVIKGNALFYFQFVTAPPEGLAFNIDNRIYNGKTQFALPSLAGSHNKMTVGYIQDDWQLNPNWAFNIGVRYEKNLNENDLGEKVVDDSAFAPRLGVSFDPTGAGKHVIKATYAHYLAGINLTTLDPFVRAAGGQSSYDIYFNGNNGGDLGNPLPGVPVWVLVAQVRPSTTGAQFAPGIKPQRIEEWALSYEFALNPDYGMGLQYVDRKWNDIITEGFFYTYDELGNPSKNFIINNNSSAKRDYKAWIVKFEKRLKNNWQAMANYTYSEAQGNVTTDSGFDTYQAYPLVPDTTFNRFGYLPWDQRSVFKAEGSYRIPWKSVKHNLTLGLLYNYATGTPYNKQRSLSEVVGPGADGVFCEGVTYGSLSVPAECDDQFDSVTAFFEGRGSHHIEATQRWDSTIAYEYALTKDVSLQLRMNVYNLTNEQKTLGPVSQTWYTNANTTARQRTNYTFGFQTSYTTGTLQAPRRYEFLLGIVW